MPPKYTQRAMTQEDLEEVAMSGDATVMKTHYDNIFSPWNILEMDETISRIVSVTTRCSAGSDVDTVERHVHVSGDFKEFERLHPTLFKKLCTREFVTDERSMGMLRMMLLRRNDVTQGRMTQEEANKKVSTDTLMQFVSTMHQKQDSD
jgi:fructose-bisphosphate aldolase class 1